MVVNVNSGDMVIESKHYFRILRTADGDDVIERFERLLRAKPSVTRLSAEDLISANISEEIGIRVLSSLGFLVLSGIPGVYLISIPNVGSFLKLSANTRKWVTTLLGKTKWKELMEKEICERYEANLKGRWRDFRGVKIAWVVMECKGAGWMEPFMTPVGRGWRLTGKKE
ncbi:serine-threonine protein kinase 19 [Limtongia smithiae]|uniref:serine-threonine protein kinase 19 n=1 Tax=Limtongia smithiae TaxID=1125753 RepID=UPI0034CFF1BA